MSTRHAGSFSLCCFLQAVRHLWPLHMSRIICYTDLPLVGMSIWPAGSLCLCWFLQPVGRLWSRHVSRIPCHMDLHPARNVYLTSWFILSVLFLTGGETSVVRTCVWEPPSHRPAPQYKHLPNQLVHSVCVVFDRWWDFCGAYTCLRSTVTQPSPQ